MRAIGFREPQPITAETSLIDLDLPEPVAAGRDLLVEVKAVSVNPVDTKVRKNARPAEGEVRVLGWDAAGIVKAVGPAGHGVQAGRRGVLCRRDRSSRLQCPVPARR